ALSPQQIPFNIYARVPGGQVLPAAYRYEGNPGPSILRYSYGPPLLAPPTAENCRDGTFPLLGGAGQSQFIFGPVSAQVPSACLISIATDLDFGSTTRLDTPRDQASLIRMRCATDVAWTMTLNNGNNPDNGQRRMASNGNYLPYELYRDPALLIPWGATPATGASDVGENGDVSFTVYGGVFPHPAPVPGSYSDTITVTLTY
ncbi:MAG: spore coat U domain-containing protein, partial [Stenotrophomonas sp.]